MNLEPVSYKVTYNGKDITRDISDHLISLSYTDKVEGESDEAEIELEDKDALWQNDWYPKKGDSIEIQIIDGNRILPCGKFSVDEKKLTSSRDGDTFTISNIAAAITKKTRTKRSAAHENKTLRQLAQTIADRHGFKIQGTIPDIRISRVTQNRKGDLAFLSTLAAQYGLVFSVRDKILTFHLQTELEKKAHSLSLDKTDTSSAEFIDKSEDTYENATVSYHNPESNEKIEYTANAEDVSDDQAGVEVADGIAGAGANALVSKKVVKPDTLVIKEKVENVQQAEVQAKSALRRKNTREQTCSITTKGNILLVSGNNVEITGFGQLSGIYHITQSTHNLAKDGGYTTSFEGKKVNSVDASKHKPRKKKYNKSSGVLGAGAGRRFNVWDAAGAAETIEL
jgi:phage protein D